MSIDLIIGLSGVFLSLIAWLLPSPTKWIEKKIRARRQRSLSEEFSKQDCSNNADGIIQLAHGVPSYYSGDLKCKLTDHRFYYPFPCEEGLAEKLAEVGFCQTDYDDFKYSDDVNCLNSSFWGNDLFNRGFACFGDYKWDNKTKEEIKSIAKEVARLFLSQINDGKVRFNGALLGVASFQPSRSRGTELPIASVNYYKTDYFTFRVFVQFYLNHYSELDKRIINGKTINNLAFPFLSSFGVATIAVVSKNDINADIEDTDTIIIGRRSWDVMVDQGKLHFTMNEAFSLRDTLYNDPSFEECASRGFKEELKWSKEVKGLSFGECHFMDFIFDSNKCEMGLTSYLKISLEEDMTIDKLINLYKESQDGILETEGLDFVAIKDARQYLNNHREEMSKGFANALDKFLRRYEMSLL